MRACLFACMEVRQQAFDRPFHPPSTHIMRQVQANIFPYYFSISFVLILSSLGAWAHLEVRAFACGRAFACADVWLLIPTAPPIARQPSSRIYVNIQAPTPMNHPTQPNTNKTKTRTTTRSS